MTNQSHRNCDHAPTKAARAKCRRDSQNRSESRQREHDASSRSHSSGDDWAKADEDFRRWWDGFRTEQGRRRQQSNGSAPPPRGKQPYNHDRTTRIIAALEAKAASTTFPAERETILAKIAQLRAS